MKYFVAPEMAKRQVSEEGKKHEEMAENGG